MIVKIIKNFFITYLSYIIINVVYLCKFAMTGEIYIIFLFTFMGDFMKE
jgi:hypothetical protein